MKRKTLALFAGGVGALGLLAMAEKYRQSRTEMKKAALIQDIRQELSHLGTIAVLYTNPTDKENPGLTGGIVLKNWQAMSKVIKRWFSFSLPIGVQTASLSIPLCLKLKPSIQI